MSVIRIDYWINKQTDIIFFNVISKNGHCLEVSLIGQMIGGETCYDADILKLSKLLNVDKDLIFEQDKKSDLRFY